MPFTNNLRAHNNNRSFFCWRIFLNLDNYRKELKSQKTYAQVVGRAGREEDSLGKAIIQTYCPESSVLKFAARQDL